MATAGTLELFMVRHGQTDMSRENRFCGSIDPPLNGVGRRMADALGAAYGATRWDAIYCSPRARAQQTARAVASRAGVEVTTDDGLREIAYGEWESLRQEDVMQRWPEAYEYWAADTASRGAPGGETAFQVAARAALVIERLRVQHAAGGRVLVVSHKATLRILTCALLGMDVRLFRDRIAQPVAAVTRFDLKPSGAMLVLLGDASHLPADLRDAEGT